MKDVELFDQELDAGSDQIVWHVVAVDLDQRGHDQQVAAGIENVSELMGGIYYRGHAVSADNWVIILFSSAEERDAGRVGNSINFKMYWINN